MLVDTGIGLDQSARVLQGDRFVGGIVSHAATDQADGQYFVAANKTGIYGRRLKNINPSDILWGIFLISTLKAGAYHV